MAIKLKSFYNRSTLLYLNFTPKTNNNRSTVLEYFKQTFKNNELVVINEKPIDWSVYLSNIGDSKFVLCPPGNGIDTHRTWESIGMGAIPIVLKTELQPLYDQMSIMVVKDWKEVTEENMKKFASDNVNRFSKDGIPWRPKLWLRYWIKKIMNEKNNYIKNFC
uniref:Exostosin GT47 domain-containing protein n=1 Tax=Panagrolaimus davidi TaxID=227884 RepID=A0A914P7R9_9BILA